MKLNIKDEPRVFGVGEIKISDYGKIELAPQEMVAVVSLSSRECDITATEWGFYLGSSINSRMRKEGFKVALVKNQSGKIFVNAVEEDKTELFNKYLINQKSELIMWLDKEL